MNENQDAQNQNSEFLDQAEGQADWLEKILMQGDHYIDDDGFTERVLMQLPPARDRRWWEPAIVITAAVLASVLAFLSLPSSEQIYQAIISFIASQPRLIVFSTILVAVFGISLGAWVLGSSED